MADFGLEILKSRKKVVDISRAWKRKNWNKLVALRDELTEFGERTASPIFVVDPEETRASLRKAHKLLKEIGY